MNHKWMKQDWNWSVSATSVSQRNANRAGLILMEEECRVGKEGRVAGTGLAQ